MYKKGSSLVHFLKNYMLFAAAVFILLVPIFFEAFRILERNIEERTYKEMVRGQSILDDEIAVTGNVIFRLRNNKNYSYVRSIKGLDRTSDYYVLLELRNYFADLTGSYTFFRSPICYFSNGIVITPKTVYFDAEKESGLLYHPVGYDSQKLWLADLVQGEYSYQFLPADTFCNAIEAFQGLPYAHTYAATGDGERAMVVSLLPLDMIYQLLGLDEMQEIARVTMVNPSTGEVLYSNGVEVQKRSRTFEIRSSQTLLSLTVEIPQSYFWGQLRGMFIVAAVYLAAFLVIAAAIALLFAYRNSKPLGKIISVLDKYTEIPHEKSRFGYEYIERSITEIGESGIRHQSRYKKLNQEMDHWMLREHILNGLDEERLSGFLSGNSWFPIPFRLAIFQLTHTEWEIPSGEMQTILGQRGLDPPFFSRARPNLFVLILRGDSSCEELEGTLSQFIRQAEETFDCHCILSVSGPLRTLENLNETYHAQRYSMKYLSSQRLIFQEKVEREIKNGLTEIDLMENVKLTDLLLAGSETEAKELISRQWYQASISQVYSMAEQLFYMQAALLNNIAAKLRCNVRVDPIRYSDTIPDMEEKMLSCAGELCRAAVKIKTDSKNDLPRQIVEYIGEHYDDPDFYMTSLADAFGISDKTIARAIKSYLHIGFSEYLEQLRLQKARLLLENPEMSVRMVAQESGFGSENTFYKAFRRIYKVSPSAYRANLEHLRDEKGEG
ncbi:MAG: helix-turn-helix transcriptional regulator [Oscillospiraceae bacterium]|nr:helix-turn-helix transcriptional regulator [Oscillospiraceae bacterium]